MNKTIIVVAAIAFCCFGYAGSTPVDARGTGDLMFVPGAIDPAALPDIGDLPFPADLRAQESARKYTGIIKNKTRYEVSVPSENSDATLIIPPNSWIEYSMWTRVTDVTAYHDGKPFYCLKLCANPCEYPFMCKKYDFMAEIVKPEPGRKYKPMKKRKYRVRKGTA